MLLCLVEPAFQALLEAMEGGDLKVAVKAAEIVLDRAGFGPKATLEIEDARDNLANTSGEELLKRIELVRARAHQLVAAKEQQEVIEGNVLDEGNVH